jgi:hypothetical protein
VWRPAELASLPWRESLLLGAGLGLRLPALLRLPGSIAAVWRPAELASLPRCEALLLGAGLCLRLPALLRLPSPATSLRLPELPGRAVRPPSLLRRLAELSRRALWWRPLRPRRRPSRLSALGHLTCLGRRLFAFLPRVVLSGAGLRQHDGVRCRGAIVGEARARECNRRQHRAGEQSVAKILFHFGPRKVRTRVRRT